LLNAVHSEFYAYGLSAVDISNDILIGRPFGGTAILCRKCLAPSIQLIESKESRITCAEISIDNGKLLLINVYMTTNYNDADSLESYVECLCKVHALIIETNATNVVIVGDFNCSPGCRFFDELFAFASEHNFVSSDMKRLSNCFTYCSDDGSKTSWIGHVIANVAVDGLISNRYVRHDIISSDHRPLSFLINSTVANYIYDYVNTPTYETRVPCWSSCNRVVHGLG